MWATGTTYERVVQLARMRADVGERKVTLYQGKREMLREHGISEQLHTLGGAHRPPLENGGYLVIDKTEAMTVIDVNTGKFVGDVDLESTVYETNLVAAREIARQVRLRNIGGLVAVDFIDMAEEAHRRAVDEALETALALDRAKSRVSPMGDMCVTIFTRKRTNNDAADFFLQPCRHCNGLGTVFSDIYPGDQHPRRHLRLLRRRLPRRSSSTATATSCAACSRGAISPRKCAASGRTGASTSFRTRTGTIRSSPSAATTPKCSPCPIPHRSCTDRRTDALRPILRGRPSRSRASCSRPSRDRVFIRTAFQSFNRENSGTQ